MGTALACASCDEAVPVKQPESWPGRRPEQIDVVSAPAPPRPFEALRSLQVRCPVEAESTRGFFGVTTTEMVGGCSYDEAIRRATIQAARINADGVFGVQTSAAGNGMIVSLVATAFRYSKQAPVTPPNALPSPAPKPSVEERLKQLLDLREKGLVTPADYERRKAEIVNEI